LRLRNLPLQIDVISASHRTTKTFEIFDTIREEDKETYFFRKTKLIPNNHLHKRKLFNLSEENIPPPESLLIENDVEIYNGSPNSKETVNFKSFEILKLVGIGSFGKIFLVKKKDDGKFYAMKVLKKRNLVVKKHLKYALTEMNILKSCDHPFIIKIYYSFQVKKSNFWDLTMKNRPRKIFILLWIIAFEEISLINWPKCISFPSKLPSFISQNSFLRLNISIKKISFIVTSSLKTFW